MADVHGTTPLHIAAEEGNDAVVTVLLAAGARVDAANSAGTTPLYVAAAHGHDAVVTALLSAGADVKAEYVGLPPLLFHAANQGHDVVVTALLAAGARADETNTTGRGSHSFTFQLNVSAFCGLGSCI
jgi:ankyrin repeat protein